MLKDIFEKFWNGLIVIFEFYLYFFNHLIPTWVAVYPHQCLFIFELTSRNTGRNTHNVLKIMKFITSFPFFLLLWNFLKCQLLKLNKEKRWNKTMRIVVLSHPSHNVARTSPHGSLSFSIWYTLEIKKYRKFSLKICFMDYDRTDVLRPSQERQAADITLGRF